MKKYESLKRQYPEYISLNQLYQICRISKRSARYLLQNGIIPCIENDNQTWRYKVALDDVITYLRRREQRGSMIPRGWANNPKKPKKKQPSILSGSGLEIGAYFNELYANHPDILSTSDVAEMTGLHINTIRKFIKADMLMSISECRTYLIPKVSLLEFVKTQHFIQCVSHSVNGKKVIGGFEIWKTAK